jgi:hypothetical protein
MATPFNPPQVSAPVPRLPRRVLVPSSRAVAEPVQPPPQPEERRERKRARATDARGYQLDPKRRDAVEAYAMERAKEAYPGADDTSATESYDLRTSDSGREVRVEVKGTLGSGDHILLTANEIDSAFGAEWRTDLFIVSEIQLTAREGEFVATGGKTHIIRAWSPSLNDLKPTQYRYRVPRQP